MHEALKKFTVQFCADWFSYGDGDLGAQLYIALHKILQQETSIARRFKTTCTKR